MKGKIFENSLNVYQDQARVLFDYYRRAAEQIVNEELRIEKEIATAEELCQQITKQIAGLKPRMIIAFIGAVAALPLYFAINWPCILISLAIASLGVLAHFKANTLKKKLAQTQSSVEGFKSAHGQIRRDYKVHKLGLAYVPVAREIPFEGRSFLVDLTGSTPNNTFSVSKVRRGELFTATIGELESQLEEAPVVEDSSEMEQVQTDQYSRSIQKVSYYDYLGGLDRRLRSAAFCLEDLDTTSVDLPTISPRSDLAAYLATYATDETNGAPVFRPFDTERYNSELETFRSLNEMKKSLERHATQFEEVLRRLMLSMAQAVQSIGRMKIASTSKLMEQSNRLLFTILKAPYNHYSAKLEAEEIERIRLETFDYQEAVESYRPFELKRSSRVLYDLSAGSWVAEDGSRTKSPFGMNQIQEEIVAPIVQNLMAETRVERLKIYNGIKDQKINYLNQWHRDTEDFYGRNRAESNDLINGMRSTFSEFVSSYNSMNALEKTDKTMAASGSLKDAVTGRGGDEAESIASYELKSREFQKAQDEFSDYMERLKEDIERRAAKYGFIQYYDASLRDSGAKSFAEAVGQSQASTLDPRRQALLAVNPYYAVASELPPPVSVEPNAYDGLALNLESLARNALAELGARLPEAEPGAAKPPLTASGAAAG
jgi:hypothetical protein